MDLTIYRFLFGQAGEQRNRIMAATVIAGVANAAFMVIVNSVARNFSEISVRYFLLFILCIAIYVCAKRYALLGTTAVVQQNLSRANLRIIEKVRRVSLDGFDEVGERTIYRSLVEHGEIIYESSRMAVSATSGAIMLLFSSLYIYCLSPSAFWITLLVIVIGVMVYQLNQARTATALREYQDNEGRFFTLLDHFLAGFKELKVNTGKGDDLYDHFLEATLQETSRLKLNTERRFVSSIVLSQSLFFILMGAMVFILPNFELTTPETTIAIVAIVLFVAGPIGIIVDSIPMLSKARLAIDSLQNLEEELLRRDDHTTAPLSPEPGPFARINLRGVIYSYRRDEQSLFSLGPLDLDIRRGEILFITGGNGSGKTTLMKLLAGLYYPQSGIVQLDGATLRRSDYAAYRALFAVIFTDFHLFDRLYGYRQTDPAEVNDWLRRLEIADKTGYRRDEGFDNLNLSTGQRKRIALVCALIENRPICLFDEVAADQDPEFREYFYGRFLPELKAQGKTIVAISHDDRYFAHADRVIKLECGTLLVKE